MMGEAGGKDGRGVREGREEGEGERREREREKGEGERG